MYTYRIEENPTIVHILDINGSSVIQQPHHPEAENFAPWASVEEAESWVIEHLEKMNNPLLNPLPALSKEELIAELEAQLAELKAE